MSAAPELSAKRPPYSGDALGVESRRKLAAPRKNSESIRTDTDDCNCPPPGPTPVDGSTPGMPATDISYLSQATCCRWAGDGGLRL